MAAVLPTLWLDADGAPRAVKEILFRVAERRGIDLVLVANSAQAIPRSPRIRQVQVGQGLDVADDWIVAHCAPRDIVITADVPLAAALVACGALVLQPRGQVLDTGNVGERLAVRDFLDGIRGAGVTTGGPPPFGPADRTRFANALDRLLTARMKEC